MHQGATSKSKRPLGGVFSTGAALASVASSVRVGQQLPGQTGKHILKRRIFFLEKSTCFKFSQVQPLGWKTNYTSYQVSRPGSLWKMSLELQMSSVFSVLWPLYTGRQTYAKLTQACAGVKGSLRGGVLFGVAYAGGYARIFASGSEEISFEATLFIIPEMASFPFILAFCGSVWIVCGLCYWGANGSCLHTSQNVGDLWLGLSVAYARLTRRLRGAYAGVAGSFWQM